MFEFFIIILNRKPNYIPVSEGWCDMNSSNSMSYCVLPAFVSSCITLVLAIDFSGYFSSCH